MYAFASSVGVGVSGGGVRTRSAVCAPRMESDQLARQGLGGPLAPAAERKNQLQRAAGIGGAQFQPASEPSYFAAVPRKDVTGDLRKEYEVTGLGNATSSRGFLDDVLMKVPRQVHGSSEYKRINRPPPARAPGFGNQSATP